MSGLGSTSESLERGGGRPLPRARSGKRRKLVAGVSALAVLGAGAGAVWAWQSLMSQGAQPAEALPDSTLAYVAVDFDPAAGQKLAALGFLRKFPSLEKHAGVTGADDLRKDLFDEVSPDLGCDLSYADLESWMGTRFAVALVEQDGPKPVAVVQIADADKAAGGLKRLADCSDGELGYSVAGDWAVLAETTKLADGVAREAAASPLAEDTEFQHWTGLAGDPGVVTLYAASEAGAAAVAAAEESPYGSMMLTSMPGLDPFSMLMGMFMVPSAVMFDTSDDYAVEASPAVRPAKPGGHSEPPMPAPLSRAELKKLEAMTPEEQQKYFEEQLAEIDGAGSVPGRAPQPVIEDEAQIDYVGDDPFPEPAIPAELRTALMNFSGLGGVIRFDDGALELELVSDRIEGTMGNLVSGTAGDDLVAELPADTVAVFSAGLRDGWGTGLMQQLAQAQMSFGEKPSTDAAAEFEEETGLTVTDLEALGGDSFSLVAGPGFDVGDLNSEPSGMKLAARISGNPDGVESALTKVRAKLSESDRSVLQWRRVGDDVLVGGNAPYLDELASAGDLAGADPFVEAVPDAKDSASLFYLNFDAGDWLDRAVDGSDRPDAEPLAGLGYSLHDEGDRERTVLRLTTED